MDARCPDDCWTVEIEKGEPLGHVAVYKDDYARISLPCIISDAHTIIFIEKPSDWARDYPRDVLRIDAIVVRIVQGLLRPKPPGSVGEIDDKRRYIKIIESE